MKMVSNKNKSILALVVVAFFYVVLNVVVRWLNLGFQPFTQVYLRLFGAFVLLITVFKKNISFGKIVKTPKKDWLPLVVMGVLGYGMMVYFVSVGALKTSLLSVSIILGMAPFFSYFLSLIFLKDVFKLEKVLLTLLSLFGVSIMASGSFSIKLMGFGTGELMVLISAILLAAYSVGRKLLSEHLNDWEITAVVMFLASVTAFLMAVARGESFSTRGFAIPIVIAGLILGSFLNAIGTFLENFSFKHLDVVLGNQILLTENLFSLLLGYFLYGEVFNFNQLIGALVVIISIYLNNRL